MKTNPILEEVWRIKDELSREFAADPDAYFAKLDEIATAEEKAGRKVVRSAEELRQLMARRNASAPGNPPSFSMISRRRKRIETIHRWP